MTTTTVYTRSTALPADSFAPAGPVAKKTIRLDESKNGYIVSARQSGSRIWFEITHVDDDNLHGHTTDFSDAVREFLALSNRPKRAGE